MEYIDLTHTFTNNMPVYPGDPTPELSQIASLDKEGYTDFQIRTGMHVGTHIDAPLHMLKDGAKLSEVPVEKFFGHGHLIQAKDGQIDETLLPNNISKGDIVIINSGFSQHYREAKYYQDYPEMTEGFARKIVELGVSIVGMDTPSPDRDPFIIHKLLLSNNVLIIENLTNLDQLIDVKEFDIWALPPKFDLEAAPVRVIAIVK